MLWLMLMMMVVLLLLLLLLVKHLVHVLNVFDGVSECVDFRHLLVLCRRRDVTPQHLEPAVDLLDPIAFAGVSSGHLGGHRWCDGVA